MAYHPVYNPQSVIGSVFTYPQANQSVSGTVNIGTIPGSVVAFQASSWPGSVLAVQGTWSGSILSQQLGTNISSVVNSTPSSLLTGSSIFGMLPAGTQVIGSVATLQGTNPWVISGSITNLNGSNVIGSIAALQGTNPWVTNFANSSIITILSAPSIVGTYAEDATHATGEKGVFVLGVRNDAAASMVGTNFDYAALQTDSAGRQITKPFVSEDSSIISYTGSLVSGSVTLIRASALGLVNHITDFWVVNTGSVAQLLTFTGGDTSIVGYTTAPATGGSNSQGINIPLKSTRAQDLRWQITGTSSVVYLAVKGYQSA